MKEIPITISITLSTSTNLLVSEEEYNKITVGDIIEDSKLTQLAIEKIDLPDKRFNKWEHWNRDDIAVILE